MFLLLDDSEVRLLIVPAEEAFEGVPGGIEGVDPRGVLGVGAPKLVLASKAALFEEQSAYQDEDLRRLGFLQRESRVNSYSPEGSEHEVVRVVARPGPEHPEEAG